MNYVSRIDTLSDIAFYAVVLVVLAVFVIAIKGQDNA